MTSTTPSADRPRHVVLVGPTASGKSALAQAAAERCGADIVSADSMQVYRGMDIGTATPSRADQARVRHHVIDVVEPDEEWTMVDHARAAHHVLAAATRPCLVVGGTGLYVRAIVDGLAPAGRFPDVAAELDAEADTAALHRRLCEVDPQAARQTQPTNRRRVLRALEVTIGTGRPFSSHGPGLTEYRPNPGYVLIGLDIGRDALDRRIADRLDAQLDAGFLDEARRVRDRLGPTASQALGYRELNAHLGGGCTLEDAVAATSRRTRRFARRQQRWFRRDPRIAWWPATTDPTELVARLAAELAPGRS